ncbi:uncharacterized protein K489DRAFT_13960 [Dissoconium aciculare CBS 342.82]|uniref:Uncharacterized protein n=1 Tax=Dissoconium aciculare CBS 342.82 TaxID=1314786 RepID=A0A6J3MHD9_9PEZI|nr:uncharacterized protein K489DRAFT_13960 [Dissoconium aciculare CBS 342.82]KAF1827366.1 hypothetical protein K489DRAFT_13960 [Dissoconium aciculare CBS 342.82]
MATNDTAPPVPPKDSPYDIGMADTVVGSSKRKRRMGDDDNVLDNTDLSPADRGDGHTPKRSRSVVPQSDDETSDDARTRSVRRKTGSRNLSNLNLRHGSKQHKMEETPRGSKFQEGSLNSKPSTTPPSFYTRGKRQMKGGLEHMDDLMEAYHDPAGDAAVDGDEIEDEYSTDAELAGGSTEGPKSFFRFGRSLSKFYPFGLWNRLYDETHEKLLQQNRIDAERKARMKAEAEARYAEMKKAGLLDPTQVSATRHSIDLATPHDSVVGSDSKRSSLDHRRNVSMGSDLASPRDHILSPGAIDAPATEQKRLRSMSSRFSLRRPSLSNLKNGLKRVASDLNLGNIAARETSSSVSPEKAETQPFASESLRTRSDKQSRDTHRLYKRISDLERKLSLARAELGNVLDEASPAPGTSASSQRFSSAPLRRPKFIPGSLPTLPSERLLFPEGGINLSDDDEDIDNQATIRATREIALPPRISSLFKDVNHELFNRDIHLEPQTGTDDPVDHNGPVLSNAIAKTPVEMDPNNITDFTRTANAAGSSTADYSQLDSKLKALDDNVKLAKKSAKSKKRKSSVASNDLAFKPSAGIDDDDDEEWAAASGTPKKKLKSGNKSAESLRRQAQKVTVQKLTPATATIVKSHVASGHKKQKVQKSTVSKPDETRTIQHTTIEETLTNEPTSTSAPIIDEQPEPEDSFLEVTDLDIMSPLEPVFEEEEEDEDSEGNTTTTNIPVKDAPSKPTAKATPARYTRRGVHQRNRSASPNILLQPQQHLDPNKSGIQAVLSAGDVAKHRRNRSISPLPPAGEKGRLGSVSEEEGHGAAIVRPATAPAGEFEWPEDVF